MNDHPVYKSGLASHECMPHNKYPHTRDHLKYVTSNRIFATSNDCCDVTIGTNLLCQSYLNFIHGIKELQRTVLTTEERLGVLMSVEKGKSCCEVVKECKFRE